MAYSRFGINDYSVRVQATEQIELHQGWDGHRLVLTFSVSAESGYSGRAPFIVSGSLWTADLPGSANWIGDLHSTAGPISLKSYATTVTLGATVTDRLLQGIDEVRAGADLTLRAYLTLTGLSEAQHWPSASGNVAIRIPGEVWRKLLGQVGINHC